MIVNYNGWSGYRLDDAGDEYVGHFSVDEMPGQCGASILFEFEAEPLPKEKHMEMYGAIKEKLDNYNDVVKWIFSDIVRDAPSPTPSLYALARYLGAEVGKRATNPNTGNRIEIYEYTIKRK